VRAVVAPARLAGAGAHEVPALAPGRCRVKGLPALAAQHGPGWGGGELVRVAGRG